MASAPETTLSFNERLWRHVPNLPSMEFTVALLALLAAAYAVVKFLHRGANGDGEAADEAEAATDPSSAHHDDVARLLAGSLVAVAAVMATLGLTSDSIFVTLNNSPGWILGAVGAAIGSVAASVACLVTHPDRTGWKSLCVWSAAGLYVVALALAVWGVKEASQGNGRPTVTDVRVVEAATTKELHFTIRADGVKSSQVISVHVYAVRKRGEDDKHQIYWTALRPNDQGIIHHKANLPLHFQRNEAGVEIYAKVEGQEEDVECVQPSLQGPVCDVYYFVPQPTATVSPSS
ncbi:hypothetical protein AB0K66_20370 [Streptomyces werraensis]|uniref:hypothetical protein n=1 Tax=Streptomyces werraensis TaxID=68284 RepID=UPI00341F86B6